MEARLQVIYEAVSERGLHGISLVNTYANESAGASLLAINPPPHTKTTTTVL
jgi:hypothetical protein